MRLNNKFTRQLLFIFLLLVVMINTNQAQDSKNKKSLKEKIWYGINVGNISIGGNTFNTNLALMGGYKMTKGINAGIILHGSYTYLWRTVNDRNFNIFDFGFGGLVNATIYKSIFAQLEVDRMYLTKIYLNEKIQKPYLMTYIGGGYKYAASNNWRMIITILYNVNPDSNQDFFPLDYRAAFVYNF